jgi:MFS transporter, PAT family, beta-lactamase induction signal transducer AmpG
MNGKAQLTWRELADARVALMLAFGYSAGLPYLLVFSTLFVWMRESGVEVTVIGMFSWLALAYSFKFLWAPFVDAVDVPVLARHFGRRRAWLLVCQALIALALVGMGLADPRGGIVLLAACTFLVAFGSATQDVVVDGWRIDAAPTERQGIMAAAYQLGYRLALLSAGAGALYMAEFVSWRGAYFAMAALMGVGMAASLLSPIVDRGPDAAAPDLSRRFDFIAAVKAPVLDLVRRKGALLWPILALVALYRLPDFVANVMAYPLYVDLGFGKADIATVSKLYGVWIGIVGAFVGGFMVTKAGLRPTLILGGILCAASNLTFTWLTHTGPQVNALIVAVSIDNFSASFAGTALIAYMSGLTAPGFVATQYALLSSLYALPGKMVGGVSGFVVQAYGYGTFFTLTSLVGIPVVLLCLWVTREPPEAPAAAAADSGQ